MESSRLYLYSLLSSAATNRPLVSSESPIDCILRNRCHIRPMSIICAKGNDIYIKASKKEVK